MEITWAMFTPKAGTAKVYPKIKFKLHRIQICDVWKSEDHHTAQGPAIEDQSQAIFVAAAVQPLGK